jgi:hypothetical protein
MQNPSQSQVHQYYRCVKAVWRACAACESVRSIEMTGPPRSITSYYMKHSRYYMKLSRYYMKHSRYDMKHSPVALRTAACIRRPSGTARGSEEQDN